MKRIVLSVMAVGALLTASCKGEKKEVKDIVKEVKTEVKEGASEVKEVTKEVTKEITERVEGAVETSVKEVTEKVTSTVKSALEGIDIPQFENPAATEYVQSYTSFAKDFIDAKGDALKTASLVKKAGEFEAKGKDVLSKLNADDASKFNSVMNAISSKLMK